MCLISRVEEALAIVRGVSDLARLVTPYASPAGAEEIWLDRKTDFS